MAKGDTKTNQYLDIAANGTRADLPTDTCCETRSQTLIRGVAERIMDLEDEVHEWENNPDVADIVDTYADLEDYDTSTLTDKDIIRVLNDETHNGESTYYRYSKTGNTWTYVGSTGPRAAQSDWEENDSTKMSYILNRPFYSESAESDIAQYGSTEAGATPDADYVWFVEKVEEYDLADVLSAQDGDIVQMNITYSVNGVTKTDGAKFVVSVEGNNVSLDSEAAAGNRWRGAYASGLDGDTTFRWPVAASDRTATVYITHIDYEEVKELDAKYIPIDGETIAINADGELQAVDTGATYIAGDGIDISNAVISATNTGLAKVLTADDYNYPANNPDGVALWLLPRGLYTYGSPTKVYFDNTGYYPNQTRYKTFLVYGEAGINVFALLFSDTAVSGKYYNRIFGVNKNTGALYTDTALAPAVDDTLTSTSTGNALSANQGRALKNLIDSLVIKAAGAPTTSTVGQIGQLLEDTTNGKLYICTGATGGVYTWEEVGAGGSGGGGITELTSADYNYDYGSTGTNNRLALWLLEPGVYSVNGEGSSVRVMVNSARTDEIYYGLYIISGFDEPPYVRKQIEAFYNDNGTLTGSLEIVSSTSGAQLNRASLTPPPAVQVTGTSTRDVMSQNATTSMVFADPSTKNNVRIGNGAQYGANGVAIGSSAKVGTSSVAIGQNTDSGYSYSSYYSIALGAGAQTRYRGQFDVSTGDSSNTNGYNNSNYRLLTGLYDPQSDHDAATKGYVDGLVGNIASALNAINNGGNN